MFPLKFMNFNYFLKYLFVWDTHTPERERESFHLIIHSSNWLTWLKLVKLNLGDRNFFWVSHMGVRSPSMWATFCWLARHINMKLDEKRSCWDSSCCSKMACCCPPAAEPTEPNPVPWLLFYDNELELFFSLLPLLSSLFPPSFFPSLCPCLSTLSWSLPIFLLPWTFCCISWKIISSLASLLNTHFHSDRCDVQEWVSWLSLCHSAPFLV